jgi:thioredoxin 1
MSTAVAPSSAAEDWLVICLCAQWCGTCRDWRPALEQLAALHPGLGFAWVDIEDQADEVGDIDIETFPTLLIAQGSRARFLGPVLPQTTQITRLVASLRDDDRAGAAPPQAQALLDRLRGAKLERI